MKLVGTQKLDAFRLTHTDAASHVDSWVKEIRKAEWGTPHDMKARYPKASIIDTENVVFNIYGNRYRLWVKISYKVGVVLIKRIGTHQEYDKWDIA